MSGPLDFLTFFSTGFGLMVVGAIAAGMILFWEWRLALTGLFVVQVGVAAVSVQVEKLPAEWAGVMTAVTGLTCLILALSAQQTRRPASLYQSGTFLLRAMVLILVFAVWQAVHGAIRIPEIAAPITSLFVWLAMCVLILLALSENPLFYGVALLLWTIPVQAVVGVLLGIPALIALIGMIELVIALACSYLMLAEQLPVIEQQPVLTDIAFPDPNPRVGLPIPPAPPGMDGIDDLAAAWWGRLRRRTAAWRRSGSVRPGAATLQGVDRSQGHAMTARKQP